jgi:uncharacterized protein (DUF58 family)
MNGRGIAVCLIAAGLLLLSLASRNATLALAAVPFIAYLAMGMLGAPGSVRGLRAVRRVETALDGESAVVSVAVDLINEGGSNLYLCVEDSIPGGARALTGSPTRLARLGPGESTRLAYAFTAARGIYRWTSLNAKLIDPLWLSGEAHRLPAPGEAAIRPKARRFRPFSPSMERTLGSPGSIAGARAGNGTDFWGIREYRPGDQMRRLDWKRSARFPGRLFTRENEQEDIADFALIVDARAQAAYRSVGRALGEIAIDAAASLAELLLRGGNRVGMALCGESMDVVYPGYGKPQLQRILRALAEIDFDGQGSFASFDMTPLQTFSPRALLIVLSPIADGVSPLFRRLRAGGNLALLVSPDAIDYTKTEAEAEVQDKAGSLAYRVARAQRLIWLREIARLGIRVVDWKVDTPLAPLVRNALRPVRGRGGSGA